MGKRVLWAVVVLVAVGASALATQITNDILGIWVNVDPETGGLAKMVVLPTDAGGLSVLGYGACSGSFCEWGATPLYLASMPPMWIAE